MAWQSFESAPTDGRVVDLWVSDGHAYLRVPNCYCDDDGQWWSYYADDGKEGLLSEFRIGHARLNVTPSHWMEQPEIPD